VEAETPAGTDTTESTDDTDPKVDAAGASEGSAPKLSGDSASKSADADTKAVDTKASRSGPKFGPGARAGVPKAGVSDAPRQRAEREAAAAPSASSGGDE
ncbi:MAG: hypothetical protein ACSLFA_04965, partial [Mycobacterium sp.]